MSRRKIIKKRFPKPDPVYNNYLVSILVSRLIKDGKKTLAQNIVCDALDIIAYKTESDPIEVFEQAVKNVTPLVEVKARRFGGATYQVPMEVTSFRGTNLALRWIVKASRSRTGKTIALKLAAELMDASKILAMQCEKNKILIKWPKLIKLLHISVIKVTAYYKK